MNFDERIQLQVLKLKSLNSGIGGRMLDQLLDQAGENHQIRQMCAKVSSLLIEDLENVCTILDMSKREFIESAVSEALEKAHEVINRSGVMDQMQLGDK
jgi:hypothetical protein